MGQTLTEPVTAKETSVISNDVIQVGCSSMQGWRISMEDAHCVILSLEEDKDASYFGVFDGHGGGKVAQYAGSNLHKKVVSQPAYAQGNIEEAMRKGFLQLDEDMLNDNEMKDEYSGSTANVILIKDNKIYCGNVGDSRAIACVNGAVQQLSYDHKPGNENECKRIIAAGGWVEFNRVNGNLALSRALGDFVFKKNDTKSAEEQMVTAYPDTMVVDITPEHEFIVQACDGIWDVLTNQEVIDFVRARIAQRMQPEIICEELMMRCLAPDCQMGGLGCDNMTVILICFINNKNYDNLAERCGQQSVPSTQQQPQQPQQQQQLQQPQQQQEQEQQLQQQQQSTEDLNSSSNSLTENEK